MTTLGYFLIGAAVFYGSGEEVGGVDIISRLSLMYTSTYGAWSKGMFLIGALCTLLSTLIVGTAAFARMWSDMLISLGWLSAENDTSKRSCQRWVQSVYLIAFLIIALVAGKNPEKMVIFGQYVAGLFTTPLLMVAICWMAFRTDRRVRMGKVTSVLLVLSVVVIATCVVASKLQ